MKKHNMNTINSLTVVIIMKYLEILKINQAAKKVDKLHRKA
jgi:hypothetical protein